MPPSSPTMNKGRWFLQSWTASILLTSVIVFFPSHARTVGKLRVCLMHLMASSGCSKLVSVASRRARMPHS